MAIRRGKANSKRNLVLLVGGVLVGAAGIGFYFVYLASLDVGKTKVRSDAVADGNNENELDPAAREKVQAATVRLCVTQGRAETYGSGFFCSPGLIMTDIDVLGDVIDAQSYMGKIIAVLQSGVPGKEETVSAHIKLVDPYSRLAFLQLDGAKQHPAPLDMGSTAFMHEGNTVFIPGFATAAATPGGNPALDVTAASVAHVSLRKSGTPVLQLETPIDTSCSGAPVVNNKGMVMGLMPFHKQAAAKADVMPLEDMNFSLNGYVADLSLKTTNSASDRYTFDIVAKVIDPMDRAKGITFYYWLNEEGAAQPEIINKAPVALTQVQGGSTWKGSVSSLILKPRIEFWSQTGFVGAAGGECLAQAFNRAAELGVPGAKQPVLAEAPRPQPANPQPYRPPPQVYTPPPPPPPPDSPGWTFGYKTDESSGKPTGSYEESSNGDYRKSVNPVITSRH